MISCLNVSSPVVTTDANLARYAFCAHWKFTSPIIVSSDANANAKHSWYAALDEDRDLKCSFEQVHRARCSLDMIADKSLADNNFLSALINLKFTRCNFIDKMRFKYNQQQKNYELKLQARIRHPWSNIEYHLASSWFFMEIVIKY